MKRYGNLWEKITAWDNLLLAARRAQKGKRYRQNVLEFNHQQEAELLRIQQELKSQHYQPGGYRTFRISDPKPRLISAAPYRDRVVHHALCNVIVPLIEKCFIDDSYANRQGYGTHRALQRFTHYARSNRYVLQCDIQKYFPSIDHQILKNQLQQSLKCAPTLWLLELIIDSSNPQETVLHYYPGDDLLTPIQRPKGLPIGNLTSQFLANVYLNQFDHWVKETLKARHYLRYVDDMALFSNNPDELKTAKTQISHALQSLRLKLHPNKSQLSPTQQGANFVGFRILPDRTRVRNDNLQRGRRRLKHLQQAIYKGSISPEEEYQRLQGWEAHLRHGDTYRLRQKIFQDWDYPLWEDR
ncbi:MAG: RNA-directed DNA polymerase [Snowella sp.]|nr:RNA-directed DNA polymerase [Snowella sp.]